MSDRQAELRAALMLLTRLPAGTLTPPVPPVGASLWAFPVAGLAVGAIGALVALACGALALPPMVGATLILAAMIAATGGLHEDGFADTADGFGGGRDAAHALEIMRDSRQGTYGVLALVLSSALRIAAMAAMLAQGAAMFAVALMALCAASRSCMALALGLLPPARPDGLGREAAGATPGALGLGVSTVLGALPLLALGPVKAMIVAAAMAAACLCLGALARRRIGGQTGDVLGAMQIVAEMTGWVALAAVIA